MNTNKHTSCFPRLTLLSGFVIVRSLFNCLQCYIQSFSFKAANKRMMLIAPGDPGGCLTPQRFIIKHIIV